LPLDAGCHLDVRVRITFPQTPGHLLKALRAFLRWRIRNHRDRSGRITGQVFPKLVDQCKPQHSLSGVGQRFFRAYGESQPSLDELEELADRILCTKDLILVRFRNPLRQDRFARNGSEDSAQDRSRPPSSSLLDEGDDVVITDAGWPQHLVDLTVRETCTQDRARVLPELRFVGRAPSLELHQDRRVPIPLDTRQVHDQGIGLVEISDGLNRVA